MIKSIRFQNFKVLKDATLPLNKFTLIVGPNGSGKSTAMEALHFALNPNVFEFNAVLTAALRKEIETSVEVEIEWEINASKVISKTSTEKAGNRVFPYGPVYLNPSGEAAIGVLAQKLMRCWQAQNFLVEAELLLPC